MSSKGGTRAKGTDGSDYSHRETVASHYQISARNKSRLKLTLFAHILLAAYIALKVLTEVLQFFGVSDKQLIKLPKSLLWEWLWLSSLLCILPAYIGIRKNNVKAMKVFFYGTFVSGFSPLVGAVVYHWSDLKVLIHDLDLLMHNMDESKIDKFKSIPMVMIYVIFVSFALLVHALSIFFAANLVQAWAWTPNKGKKKS